VRFSVTPYRSRAKPILSVQFCDANPLFGCSAVTGSQTSVDTTAARDGTYRASVVNTDQRAGVDTDYLVRVDRLDPPAVTPDVGPWYNPARSGNGIDFQRVGPGLYTAMWYTYRTDGTPIWYVSDVAPLAGNRWHAPIWSSTWDGTHNRLTLVGGLQFVMTSADSATMLWTLDGASGSEPFIWLNYAAGGTGIANGLWYPPAESGWGASIWHQGNTLTLLSYTYDAAGQATWAWGVATGDPANISIPQEQFNGADSLCPGCTGLRPRISMGPVGSATFMLTNAVSGDAHFNIDMVYTAAVGAWHHPVEFKRISN
jgi:hypothetical protein